MNYIWNALLGAIQGLTECLPISSSAHVEFVRHLLGMETSQAFVDNGFFHLGSGIALLLILAPDLKKLTVGFRHIFIDVFSNIKMALGMRRGYSSTYHKPLSSTARILSWQIFVATIVAAVAAILLKPLAQVACTSILAPGIGLFMTAIFLLVSLQIPPIDKQLKNMKILEAVFIGLLEGCAVFPGLSRFALVLAAASITGMSRINQYRFAIFSAVPLIFGNVVYQIGELIYLKQAVSPEFIPGLVTAFLVTLLVGNLELNLVKRYEFRKFFVAWCFLAGAACTICYFMM